MFGLSKTIAPLTNDAKAVLGLLAMMHGIGFQMQRSKPSPRMQAALDELVAKGAATAKPNVPAGVLYSSDLPMRQMKEYADFYKKIQGDPEYDFDITVPV